MLQSGTGVPHSKTLRVHRAQPIPNAVGRDWAVTFSQEIEHRLDRVSPYRVEIYAAGRRNAPSEPANGRLGRLWVVFSPIFILLHLVDKQRLAAGKEGGRGKNSKNRAKNDAFWQAKRASRPTFFTFAFL
jgi:hypothetical protein